MTDEVFEKVNKFEAMRQPDAPDVAASTDSAASDNYGICEHGRPKHSRCVDCENEKEPGELVPAQYSAIDEARALALLNAIKCCEHVLRRIGAPENTIARFRDGDCGHVIWWIDTQWPNNHISWVKGEVPLKRILLLWNGNGLFGPVAFQKESDRENYCQHLEDHLSKTAYPISGRPTHYLIVPKCECRE